MIRAALTLSLAIVLAACGGGGSSGGGMVAPIGLGAPTSAAPAQAQAKAPEPAPAPTPAPVCTVALYGDSILYGGYSIMYRLAEPPAKALARMRPALVVSDHSQNGDSAAMRMPAFINDSLDGARVVVIEHGINDAGNSMPYEPAMRAMLERVLALKAKPVVTGLIQVNGGLKNRDAYDALAHKLAAEYGAVFADWGSIPVGPDDTHDGLHPKQALSHKLVEKLAVAIDAAMPECAGVK